MKSKEKPAQSFNPRYIININEKLPLTSKCLLRTIHTYEDNDYKEVCKEAICLVDTLKGELEEYTGVQVNGSKIHAYISDLTKQKVPFKVQQEFENLQLVCSKHSQNGIENYQYDAKTIYYAVMYISKWLSDIIPFLPKDKHKNIKRVIKRLMPAFLVSLFLMLLTNRQKT